MHNQAQLIGYTGADVEIRTAGDKKVAVLRVCTSRYTKKSGERKDYATWHQVEIWNQGTVTWLAKGLAKGTLVFVQGEIRNERFTDNEGVERFFTKVMVAAPGHELRSLRRPGDRDPGEEG
jgi:single-strand DNA-binding protein